MVKKADRNADRARAGQKSMSARREKFVEGVLQGKPASKAAEDAGYSKGHSARTQANRLLTNVDIQKRIAARVAESNIESKEVLGTLASHMRADLADILPEDEILKRAKANGVSHLIKKLKVRTRIIHQAEGPPIEEVTHEIEMYSSQEAAKVLSGVLGLQKEPGKNPYDAAKDALTRLRERFPELDPAEATAIIAGDFGVEVDQISDTVS